MSRFSRGDRVEMLGTNEQGIVLGPDDFSGYAYNRPDEDYELVVWSDDSRSWTPTGGLRAVNGDYR